MPHWNQHSVVTGNQQVHQPKFSRTMSSWVFPSSLPLFTSIIYFTIHKCNKIIHNLFWNSSPIHDLPNPRISRKATNNLFNYPTKKQKHTVWKQYPQPKVAEVNTNNSPNSHKLSTLADTAAVDTIRHHVIMIAATHTQCCASMATVRELTVIKWLPPTSTKQ